MGVTGRLRVASRVAVVAGIALAAVVVPGSVGSADTAIRYAALGDSRAAGPYLDPTAALNGCGRSVLGYPALVAESLQAASFTNLSCTGARTDHLTSTPQQTFTGPMVPQIDALPADTTLVTVSIGGNDIRWSGLVSACYTEAPGADAGCRDDPALAARVTAALDGLGPKVSAALAAIKRKAPGARVVLVGHGGIYDGRGCWPNLPVGDADAGWITAFFGRLNRVLAGAAGGAGAEFVDVATGAAGHDACAAPEDRWFAGRVSLSEARPLHPTARGMQHMAGRVLARLGGA